MLQKTVTTLVLAGVFAAPLAVLAQHDDHHDDHHGDFHDNPHPYVRHNEWRHGYHLDHGRWDGAPRVDYQHYHLHRPPNGYEWREVDGNFVEAAIATGIIASVVAASH